MMGQQQPPMLVAAGSALMRRMILVLAVAAFMAVAITATTAAPAFAAGKSAASEPTPYKGANFGHYRSYADVNGGQETAEINPSYLGGKDKSSDSTSMSTKQN